MRKKIEYFIVSFCAVVLLISSVYCEEQLISGVAKTFDSKTGILVMRTTTQSEAAFTIPQTVKAYVRVEGKDIEVADAWKFLKDNVKNGTKIRILESGGAVTTIWILEVPA